MNVSIYGELCATMPSASIDMSPAFLLKAILLSILCDNWRSHWQLAWEFMMIWVMADLSKTY